LVMPVGPTKNAYQMSYWLRCLTISTK
jgi:hypothetical protein